MNEESKVFKKSRGVCYARLENGRVDTCYVLAISIFTMWQLTHLGGVCVCVDLRRLEK